MRVKQNKTAVLGKTVKTGLVGSAVVILMILILTAVAAFLMDKGAVDQQNEGTVALITQATAFLLGTWLSAAMVKEKKLQTAGITVGVSLFVLVAAVIVIWDGSFSRLLTGVLVCLFSGVAGLLVNLIPRKGKRPVKVRYC